LEHDGQYVVTASNAGFDRHPGWFHNLTSNPRIALRIRDQEFAAVAERADPALRQRLWDTFVERAPGYGAYSKRTTREIPIILLRPVSPS
jgi:deazaflavin-dependent oxidoreductase (nitroreductase family)